MSCYNWYQSTPSSDVVAAYPCSCGCQQSSFLPNPVNNSYNYYPVEYKPPEPPPNPLYQTQPPLYQTLPQNFHPYNFESHCSQATYAPQVFDRSPERVSVTTAPTSSLMIQPTPPQPFHPITSYMPTIIPNPNWFNSYGLDQYTPPEIPPPYTYYPPQPPEDTPQTPPLSHYVQQSPCFYTPPINLTCHTTLSTKQPLYAVETLTSMTSTIATSDVGTVVADSQLLVTPQVFDESPATLTLISDDIRHHMVDKITEPKRSFERMIEDLAEATRTSTGLAVECDVVTFGELGNGYDVLTECELGGQDDGVGRGFAIRGVEDDEYSDVSVSVLGGNAVFNGSGDAYEGFDLFKEAEESDGGEENWNTTEGYETWDLDSNMEEDGATTEKGEGNDIGLFASAEYDEYDEAADAVWEKIDNKMDLWMKDRREARLKHEVEKFRASNPKFAQQFAELTRKLHGLSKEEWDSIPEIGDYSLRYKKKRFESFDVDGEKSYVHEIAAVSKNVNDGVVRTRAYWDMNTVMEDWEEPDDVTHVNSQIICSGIAPGDTHFEKLNVKNHFTQSNAKDVMGDTKGLEQSLMCKVVPSNVEGNKELADGTDLAAIKSCLQEEALKTFSSLEGTCIKKQNTTTSDFYDTLAFIPVTEASEVSCAKINVVKEIGREMGNTFIFMKKPSVCLTSQFVDELPQIPCNEISMFLTQQSNVFVVLGIERVARAIDGITVTVDGSLGKEAEQNSIPSAAGPLLSQFEGNYVYLSMLKFSSHVVENCLKFFEESRPKIIAEFLSVLDFSQLLQDPFANYVVQSALEVSKDHLRDALVQAIEAGVGQRLVELLLHPSPTVLIPALRTVGNIVTGDSFQTQSIINYGALPCLLSLLTHNHKKSIKKEACWTSSNITAGHKEQIQAAKISVQIFDPGGCIRYTIFEERS